MSNFLLELRSEEIPARMQAGARSELEKLFRREMDAAGVSVGDLTVWSTPRRLALIARDLPEATEAVSEEAKGPPVGAPDQAVDGFCRKNGVTRDDLDVRDVKGRETYFAVKNVPGKRMGELLAAAIPAIIRDFSWPKSMRWGEASRTTESLRWVRPLSGIVALLGDEVVECEVHGVTSGAVTLGHRFHHSGDITIGNADDYAMKLRAAHVIVDHEERATLIRDGAQQVASEAGLTLVEDEGLVIENAGLTEWPVPLLGRFEDDFLEVPPETIQLTARVNQKYFVCESKDGKLANAFICTANIEAADPAVVVDGNRKVLAARLSDARFFWDVDRKKTLEEHAEGLKRITFHEKLGTVADKVERVAKLARWLVEEGIVADQPFPPAGGERDLATQEPSRSGVGADAPMPTPNPSREREGSLADLAEQAARLAKADLVTEMVGEFPELQGLMGGYYARAEGLPDEVADAIRDHYKPVGQGDDVPTAPVTVAVSLADKLDTLFGFFAIGERPTGSKDPFALRRASLGTLALIQENNLRIRLGGLIQSYYLDLIASWASEDRYSAFVFGWEDFLSDDGSRTKYLNHSPVWEGDPLSPPPACKKLWLIDLDVHSESDGYLWLDSLNRVHRTELVLFNDFASTSLDFFADRLKVQQREAGVRHDLIDAVFALGEEDDLVRLLARVHALQAFVETDNGTNLLAGYKRAANILRKENYPVTPAQAGVQSDGSADAGMDSGLRRNDDLALTGDEDPLENVDDPEMRGVYAAQVSALSYMPEPAEKALIDALKTAEPQAEMAIAEEDFAAAMSALASLRAPIDAFFEEVTVNDEDEVKRKSRLGLLARFRAAVHNVADFSKIES
ncbi:glycine--tRNA ligase subunit beta [Aurantiacibacter sediminis]|uniref:Glycine--tRNA ligase beta subunit n=1 Tax=Aurantiacibacter sediminis TaxID=2793064 RepID=A0ABS0N3W0_9SPHN|nr:glycine--tRNA ligase subunit beta [Aurantiacibacter sediminis]MBH5322656.1 glycine--tRNA ligase subunit beta [Aurantiacibacter sediminis]